MTEAEILKAIFSYLPTIGIAVGVAKIYIKITTFIDDVNENLKTHSTKINQLYNLHLKNHPDDAVTILKKENDKTS
jgi:hypothetical protein